MLGNIDISALLPAPIAEAYRDGRVHEKSVPAWLAKFEAAPEATADELSRLAPGVPPDQRLAGEAASGFTPGEAYESLFGRTSAAQASSEPPATPPPPSAAPVIPAAGFTDADFVVATASLFPNGVGGDSL